MQYYGTIGPARADLATLAALRAAGMTGVRLNLSHGSLADRAECRRILKEENVAIMPAYMNMHFLNSTGDPLEFLEGAK